MSNQSDDKIILNVGGIRYETYQTTLTAYPDTYLGNLFIHKILQPTNGNEYFIDRDGKVFRYILQYYRNEGKIYWPNSNQMVSKEELEDELKFFQINYNDSFNETYNNNNSFNERPRTQIPLRPKCEPSTSLPNFINAFDKVMTNLNRNLTGTSSIQIRFGNGYIVIEPKNPEYEEVFQPFENTGLAMVRQHGNVIQNNFYRKYRGISWNQSDDNLITNMFTGFGTNNQGVSKDEVSILLMKRF